MKQKFLVILSLLLAGNQASAQWKGKPWVYVLAYGVHDATLFQSDTGGAFPPGVDHYGPDTNWHPIGSGINFGQGAATSFASLGRYFFVGLEHSTGGSGPVWASSNNGNDWSEDTINGPIASNSKYLFGQSYSIYAMTQLLARSSDTGKTWDSLIDLDVSYMATNGACIYAVTPNDSHRSTDNGKTWSTMSYPLSPPTSLVALDTIIFGGSSTGNAGLARSLDSGATWTQITFPHAVTALVTDGKNLWAGTMDSGVYVSTDNGKNWRNVSEGLRYFLQVTAMAVYDTMMIVATVSPGSQNYWQAWRPIREMVDSTKSGVKEIAHNNNPLEVFPNPATNLLQITSSQPGQAHLFDLLGRERLNASIGASGATMDVSHLEAGMYFLRLGSESAKVEIAR